MIKLNKTTTIYMNILTTSVYALKNEHSLIELNKNSVIQINSTFEEPKS